MANYTILLIDYEPRSIERFREPLVGAGYGIEIATDGVSGIEAFHRLNPDMVLVEAMIPKKHGFEVCQELKRTPHGRKTPVIITTGVYKGRKYRTQALHIYGCDEYIEKPIAPEQLLEIVGRFLKPGPSGSPPKSPGPGPGHSESGGGPGSHETSGSVAKVVSSAKSHTARNPSFKPSAAPHALAQDDTEDEIMARLDALLPGDGIPAAPEMFSSNTSVLATAVNPIAVAPVEVEPSPVDDPFADMRAELNAELGALTTSLEFDSSPDSESITQPIPSDQLVAPSLLESLPIPDADVPIPAPFEPPPVLPVERPGQVVDFDTKRSRKHKKASKQSKEASREATPPKRAAQTVSGAPAHGAASPRVLEPVASVAELKLPRGTLVESQLEAPVAGRGMPVWVWAVAGIVAVVGLYFVFSRDMPDRSVAIQQSTPVSEPVATASIEPPAPPPPQAPEPRAAVATEAPPPVAQTVQTAQAPPPKKAVERPPARPTARDEVKPPAATSTPTPSPAPARHVAKKEPAPPPAATVTAPIGLGDSDAGVETLPDPAVAAPAATLSPGALIPIDEADTMPVSLSRRLPVYSEQARQMRLSGTVVLNALINEQGKVEQVVLVIGVPGADLNESAIRAAKTWTYRPATKNGVPVKVWKSEQIVFKR